MKLQHCLLVFATLVDVCYKCEAVTNSTAGPPAALYPIGDVRNCPVVSPITGDPLYRMEVLPGLGFDNLRNYDMNQVVQYNYSLCKMTNDARFLIPDDMITVPIQRSSLETFSEVMNHWDDHTSSTSFSINVETSAAFGLIHGKFSTDYQSNKEHQVNDHSVTTRTQVRSLLYKIMLQSDAALHPTFKNRLLDIAANIQDNNTEYAAYLSELLVRDYGTHVVRAVDAGGLMSQFDSIHYESESDRSSNQLHISASASANFLIAKMKMSASFSHSSSHSSFYEDNQRHSSIHTIGGPPYTDGLTVKEWQTGLLDLLATIDRSGDPLHWIITSRNVPELPTPLLDKLTETVFNAVNRYYTVNTIHGCTDMDASNFEYEANLDDGSCHKPHDNYTFGGVFQKCQVDEKFNYRDLCTGSGDDEVPAVGTKNPLTGDYSCPDGYEAVELHSGTVTHEDDVPHPVEHCKRFLVFRHCTTSTVIEHLISAAYYQTYWCVARGKVPDDTGYMFGGVYTSGIVNPNTGSMSCPAHFLPIKIGREVKVCVSNEYQMASQYAMPLGGFFSCKATNPLSTTNGTSTGFSQCPKSFKQLVASVEDGCEISYCAKFKVKYTSKPPKFPPFHSKPKAKTNISQAMVIVGSYGEMWIRDTEGNWHEYNKTEIKITGEDVLRSLAAQLDPQANKVESSQSVSPAFDSMSNITDDTLQLAAATAGGGMSATVSAAISSVVTLVVCGLVLIVVFGIHGIVKKKKVTEMNSGISGTPVQDDIAIINS